MQITAEVLDNEIKGMQAQKDQFEALVAKADGALSVLQGLRSYLDKPEVKVPQDNALSEKQVAELVGGEGAKPEGVVVNALGKYVAPDKDAS